EAGLLDGGGEVRALGEEAVAGVDGVAAGAERGLDQRVRAEVALGGGRRADAVRLVSGEHVGREAVGIRVDRHGTDAQLVAGTDDTERDLAAVRDQDLADHAEMLPSPGWFVQTALRSAHARKSASWTSRRGSTTARTRRRRSAGTPSRNGEAAGRRVSP